MTASLEVGGWRAELDGLLARFGRLFVRAEPRQQAGRYLEGLLGPVGRKNGFSRAFGARVAVGSAGGHMDRVRSLRPIIIVAQFRSLTPPGRPDRRPAAPRPRPHPPRHPIAPEASALPVLCVSLR